MYHTMRIVSVLLLKRVFANIFHNSNQASGSPEYASSIMCNENKKYGLVFGLVCGEVVVKQCSFHFKWIKKTKMVLT